MLGRKVSSKHLYRTYGIADEKPNVCVVTCQMMSMAKFWSSMSRIRPLSICQVSSLFLYVHRHAEMCSANTVALRAL